MARRPTSVYERVNSNLKCLIENYDEDNKLAFVRGVAHNIDFNYYVKQLSAFIEIYILILHNIQVMIA